MLFRSLTIEVDPGYHEVSPAYKAGLLCAVRLDGEYPLHRDKVLAVEVHKQQAVVLLLELLQMASFHMEIRMAFIV